MTIGALAAALALLVGGLVLFTSRGGPGSEGDRLAGDRPLRPTANDAPARGKSGPSLVVDPASPDHIVEVHQELATAECEVNASFDRGRTWTGGRLQAPPGYPGPGNGPGSPGPCSVAGLTVANLGQQSLAFGSGRNVYVTWVSTPTPNVVGSTVLLSRSSDGGATFAVGVEVPGMVGGPPPAPDFSRPELAVDRREPGTDRIYIASRDSVSTKALVVRSDDAGATWTKPVEASRSNPVRNPPPSFPAGSTTANLAGDAYPTPIELTQPVLGPVPPGGGERPLHLGWVAVNRGGPCPPDCETAGETPADGYLVTATSTDAGQTWTRTRAVNVRGFLPPSGGAFRGSSFPRMATGPAGALFVVFNQGPGAPPSPSCGPGPFPAGEPGASTRPCPTYPAAPFSSADHSISYDSDVWFLRSADAGATWGDLRQVNDPKRSGLAVAEITQTRHPQVAVAANGRIDIVWEDRRHWYLSPSVRKAAVTPQGPALDAYRCVHTHAACEEARLGDTYYAGSTDGGTTFSPNRRVNDRSHNNDVGYDFRVSTYRDHGPGVVALGDSRLLVADMDARLGSPATNSLDLFLREVDLTAPLGPLPVDHLATGGAAAISVALSRQVQPGGAEAVLAGEGVTRPASSVVIVNEDDPVAALAGGVLARAVLGPVLASPARGLPPDVKAEVDRLDPVRAFVLGDSRKLGPQIQVDLAAAGVPTDRITRISGVTAPDLAAAVARALDGRTAAERAATPALPAFDAAVIVNPDSAEAPSASALAANRRLPVLYVGAAGVPAGTRSALADLGIVKTLVVGSSGSVGPQVEAALPGPLRLAGEDQYAASAAVVAESVARGLPRNVVYVADGAEPMHAALLGAAVARLGGLLLLAPDGLAAKAEATLETLGLRSGVDRLVTSDLTGTARSSTG